MINTTVDAGVTLINTVVHLVKAGINPIKAVVDRSNVRLNFNPELLKISPLQGAHGQNDSHHHTRGQPLLPLMHRAAKARHGSRLLCGLVICWLGCG
ncbi:MAG: hypothetical protein F4026_08350 [Synechococcus sp. SB0669_bin_8]|nr:hypothetical protein [Synechococcus sp. SB0669_bin_8]